MGSSLHCDGRESDGDRAGLMVYETVKVWCEDGLVRADGCEDGVVRADGTAKRAESPLYGGDRLARKVARALPVQAIQHRHTTRRPTKALPALSEGFESGGPSPMDS